MHTASLQTRFGGHSTVDVARAASASGRTVTPHPRQLLRAVEQSPASIVIADTAGRIEYVNPRFEEITGYTMAEVLGKNLRMLKSGIHSPQFYQQLWDAITHGREWRGEFLNRKKNGELYWEQASISAVHDEKGTITHFIAVKEDITARKRNEQHTLLLAALVENTADICVLKDLSLRVLAINGAGARLLGGCTPDAMLGKTIAEACVLDPEAEPARGYREAERAAQQLKSGERIEREEAIRYADGTQHTHLTRYFPVFDATGRLIATGNISTDISSRKAAEQELLKAKEAAEAASRAKSAFLASMSHELRTPLNAINGVAATLAEEEISPEIRSAVGLIQHSGQSLLEIIEEVLLFSGLQAGQTKLDRRPFGVLEVVLRALRMVAPAATAKGLTLGYWIDPATPAAAIGDPQRLQQVLLNLLANAVKFTERGRIHLGLRGRRAERGTCRFEWFIVDTGIGIDERAAGKLFQPFTQADDSVTRRFGGTGLGLAISKSLIELMHGQVSVRSRPGRGSAFRFEIALDAPTNVEGVFAATSRLELTGRHIRVEGKDPVHRALLGAILTAWGANVHSRPGAAQPPPETPCDAAVVVVPPEPHRSSSEEPAAVAELSAALPTVFVTSTGPRALKSGAERAVVLQQPLAPSELSGALVQLLNPTKTPSPAPATPRAGRRIGDRIPLRVLVVDDIRTNCEAARMIFRHLGYVAEVAENGAEALDHLERGWFDLVMLDLQMPVMDGLTAAKEICRRYPDPARRPKVVALTANVLPGDREQCLSAGMDDYLSKPVLPQQVEAVILRLFGQVKATVPSATPAAAPAPAPTACPAASMPWIDVAHHAAMMAGVEPKVKWELLAELDRTFRSDVYTVLPKLVQACANRNSREAAELVHGLKGGALMLGWARMATRCAELVHELRAGTFTGWRQLLPEMETLFATSGSAMAEVLRAGLEPHAAAPRAE